MRNSYYTGPKNGFFQRKNTTKYYTVEKLINDYQNGKLSDRELNDTIEAILHDHEALIIKLAILHGNLPSNQAIGLDIEDFISEATISVIDALRRYNPNINQESGKATKLSSFLYSTIHNSLKTAADNSAAIRCMQKKRGLRCYHQNQYNNRPEKKLEFEKKMGWILPNGELDINAVQKSYMEHITLVEQPMHLQAVDSSDEKYEWELSDPRAIEAENILFDKLTIYFLQNRMTMRQKNILKLLVSGLKLPDIAKALNLDIAVVRSDNKRIRRILSESMEL